MQQHGNLPAQRGERLHTPSVNPEVRELVAAAEQAAHDGLWPLVKSSYVAAGICAVQFGHWRTAVRCYRNALEIDLLDRTCVMRIAAIVSKLVIDDWVDYLRAVDAGSMPAFGCRHAQVVGADLGTVVRCPGVGPVLELIMSADDLVEVRPEARFAGMPIAMAMIVLRRGLWPKPVEQAPEPRMIRVGFAGRSPTTLDELGDWSPLPE